MKILIDMNLSPRWAEVFSKNNIEAVHWSQIGLSGAMDSEIMTYAKTNGYAVFTHDLDFGAILAVTHNDKPSVIQIRTGDIDPTITAQLVINALRTAAEEIEKGALITIDLNKTRIRILPLTSNQ
jgi:predicted nuclease of predicted toxin-antitoxin system